MAQGVDFFQFIGRLFSTTFGRDSKLIRALRPGYERALEVIYRERGIPWSINGVPFRIDPTSRHLMGKNWDADVAAFLRDHVKPGALCLDIGANAGVYVLQLCHWSAPNGRVNAFEPNPITRGILERHIAMNDYSDRVEVVPIAASDRVAETEFHFSGSSGMSRLGRSNPVLAGHDQIMTVTTVTLDAFCEQHSLQPNWLLIDIEGYELRALLGARKLLSTMPDLKIVVEMHPDLWPADHELSAVEGLLAEVGFKAEALTGQADPFREYGLILLSKVTGCTYHE